MAGTSEGELEKATVQQRVVPALLEAGWDEAQFVYEYRLQAQKVISGGAVYRVMPDGYADIVLEARSGLPVAVVEAKRKYRTADDAIQQAVKYAQQLDVPFAYGTNGVDIIERNMRTGGERHVTDYVPPAVAWSEYLALTGIDDEQAELVVQPFNRGRRSVTGDVVRPRYYQAAAINRVLTAIAKGDRRILLLMATGTGKTFTAMQIVSKLRSYESLVRPGRNYRVLYLADRDALLSQPMRKDFTPAFGNEALTRVFGRADTSREIYFATYQALSGANPDSTFDTASTIFASFRPDFFDLVIVDECHRGSADADSSWRRVLDYFQSAVQLGLTATPRDDTVHSYEYFGNPVFTYSLREGIADGYLAPYKIRRVVLTPDAEGWEPTEGERDRYGREIPEGIYSTRDFERTVSLLARTQAAARHLSATLRRDSEARAVIFCVDVEHANDMRSALIAQNPDLVLRDPEWCVRIVGIEGEKERLLEDFTDPTRNTPVVATTSKLLSTGVDIEDLKFVVLFRPVGSQIEFKQIIGRGTRLYPDKGKTSFEIIDYVNASIHFEDPGFDGFPTNIVIEVIDGDGEVVDTDVETPKPPDDFDSETDFEPTDGEYEPGTGQPDGPEPEPERRKLYVDGGEFHVETEAVLVPSVIGRGLRLTEYGQLIRDRLQVVGSEGDLRRHWAAATSRHQLLAELAASGIDVEDLTSQAVGEGTDPLDLLMHLAWNTPMRTRAERTRRVREQRAMDIASMSEQARRVFEGLLQRYELHGVEELETLEVLRQEPLSSIGSPVEIARAVGGKAGLTEQMHRAQEWLYA